MATRTRRLAFPAAMVVSAFALSGCHEMFHFGFGFDPSDPPA